MLIIPAIDLKDGQCVRLRQGLMSDTTVFSDDPIEMATKWVNEGARRLHLVDLNGAFEGKPVNADCVNKITQSFPEIPVQIGGGIRDLKIANNVAGDVGGDIIIQAMNGENSINCVHDAQVELSYNGTKKLETTNSGAITSGIHTVTVGTDLDGYKVEEGSYDTNALNGEFDFELENGHVQTHTGSTAGTYFPDFRVSSSQSLSSVMDVGDVVSCTLMVASSSHYCTTGIKIDNSTSNLTIEWVGGSAPSAANGSGYDIYGFTIQKTAATPAYLIIGNAMGAA